jgi:hypothetical protein
MLDLMVSSPKPVYMSEFINAKDTKLHEESLPPS